MSVTTPTNQMPSAVATAIDAMDTDDLLRAVVAEIN